MKQHCLMTYVNFIIEDIMLSSVYLFENIMFTNKVNQSIVRDGKRKHRFSLIKSLINAIV